MTAGRAERAGRTLLGVVMTAAAVAALLISLYLTWTKLAGEAPTCGVLHGCDTVSSSPYSELLGIPVALFGAAAAAVTLAASVAWWARGDRRALVVAYGIGLASLPFLAYLTYLEVAVIGAICVWCVTYAVAVVVGWVAASVALLRKAG